MKIAITGKGGTGKTTIAGILAHYFNKNGYQVFAIDADPDANLASALGFPSKEAERIEPLSKQSGLIMERTGAKPGKFGQFFKLNPVVKDIPEKYYVSYQGIRLLVLGAIQKGGDGCACPENVFLKSLLSEIILNRNEVIILDMEAGIEHLGRATSQAVDKMIIVVEPGLRSVSTARNIMDLARDIGISSFGIIGNKKRDARHEKWFREQFAQEQILGIISYDTIIQDADLSERPLIDSLNEDLEKEFGRIYESITKK